MPFTLIEEQNYSTLFKQMSEDCGLTLDGTPRTDDWNPNSHATIEKMQKWLIRLRQTCVRNFGVYTSSFELDVESRDMYWECSLSRSVSQLIYPIK